MLRTIVILLLLPVLAAGCMENAPEQPQGGTTPTASRSQFLNVTAVGNGSTTIARLFDLELPAGTTAAVNFTATGPQWKGVTVLQYRPNGPTDFVYHAFVWARHEYARSVVINELSGEQARDCLGSVSPDGECELFDGVWGQYRQQVVNDESREWMAGRTRLLVEGEVMGMFNATIHFSNAVQIQERPVLLSTSRISSDLFDARYADMVRCLDVGFCGAIVGGHLGFEVPVGHVGYLRLQGHSDPMAYLHVCVNGIEPSVSSGCIQGTPTIGLGYFQTFAVQGTGLIQLDAAGAPYTEGINQGTSSHYIGGRLIVLPIT